MLAVKQHGSNARDDSGIATVPTTVPDLPDAYQVREVDLAKLKSAILGKSGDGDSIGGGSSTTLKKVVAHGMGGAGKTTLAAAVVQDRDVRTAFSRLVRCRKS